MPFNWLRLQYGTAKALAIMAENGENIDRYLSDLTFLGWLDLYLATTEGSALANKALNSLLACHDATFELWLSVFFGSGHRPSLKRASFNRLSQLITTPLQADLLLSAVALCYPEIDDLSCRRIRQRFSLLTA